MPFILLSFAVLIGGYALYHFLRHASRDQAQKILLTVAICLITLIIFVLILVGRLPLAAKLYAVFNKSK
jgi:drug/metabolite transporter superfamily protein YnfA